MGITTVTCSSAAFKDFRSHHAQDCAGVKGYDQSYLVNRDDLDTLLQQDVDSLCWNDALQPAEQTPNSGPEGAALPQLLHSAASAYGSDLLQAAVAAEAWDWTGMDTPSPLHTRSSLGHMSAQAPDGPAAYTKADSTMAPARDLAAAADGDGNATAVTEANARPFDSIIRLNVSASDLKSACALHESQQSRTRLPKFNLPELPADFLGVHQPHPQPPPAAVNQRQHDPDPVPQPETWAGNDRWLEAILARIPVPGAS